MQIEDIKPRFLGCNRIILDTVGSTNAFAADLIKSHQVANGTLIITKTQSSGVGRRGHLWTSKSGENITCSLLVQTDFLKLEESFYLNIISALAVRKTLMELVDLPVNIKWPNDLLISNKKVCGILIQNSIQANKFQWSILGIGLNLNQMEFPEDLTDAGSVRQLTGQTTNLLNCIDSMMRHFETYYWLLENGKMDDLIILYNQYLYGRESALFIRNQASGMILKGKIVEVASNGFIQIDYGDFVGNHNLDEIKIMIQ